MADPSLYVKIETRGKDKLPGIEAAIRVLKAQEVAIGWPADKDNPREEKTVETNADIAYKLDKGSPALNQPPRAVLAPAIEDVGRAKIEAQLKGAGIAALEGDADGVEKSFIGVGVEGVTAIRKRIESGDFPKLSERTLAGRRARGRFGTKPWQDTGQIRNAANFTLRKRK